MVDLTIGVRNHPEYKGEFQVTSPPAVVNGVLVIGNAIADNRRVDTPAGIVRGFDARSGALRWSWDPVAQTAGAPGYDTWRGEKAHTSGEGV